MTRDTGRLNCYRAEWEVDTNDQLPWNELLSLAKRVVADETVKHAYPRLAAQPLKLQPVMKYRKGFIGRYTSATHRIELAWGGRSALTLFHELAHAATHGGHQQDWRTAYVFLTWRFLGEDQGKRLAAAFINHGVLENKA